MKKAYRKPQVELVEYRFADHVAASGATKCLWGRVKTNPGVNCEKDYYGDGYWIIPVV